MKDMAGERPSSSMSVACLLTGVPDDAAALAEAAVWRAALNARLTVLVALPTPRYVAFPDGGVWWNDLAAVEKGMRTWLEERTAGLTVDERVVLPDTAEFTLCKWAKRRGVDMLIVGRGPGGIHRLLHGDTAAYLVRHAPCPVLTVAGSHGASRRHSRESGLFARNRADRRPA